MLWLPNQRMRIVPGFLFPRLSLLLTRMVFRGVVAITPTNIDDSVKELLSTNGALVVHKYLESVDCAVVNEKDPAEALACHQRLKGKRLPIVYPSWVRACVQANRLLPRSSEYCCYDPAWLRGQLITTSMLSAPQRINVKGCTEFFGGTFERHLTTSTTLVIVGGTASKKVHEAMDRGIAVESLDWFQRCVDQGRLLPFSNRHCTALAMDFIDDILGIDLAPKPNTRAVEGTNTTASRRAPSFDPPVTRQRSRSMDLTRGSGATGSVRLSSPAAAVKARHQKGASSPPAKPARKRPRS